MNMHTLAVLGLAGLGSGDGNTPRTEDPNQGLISINLAEDVTMKVFGRLFYDWGWFSGDEATFFTDSTGTTPELEDATEFRAARIGVEGTLYEKVGYKAEFDFAGDDDVELKDVYMGVKDTPAGEFRAGHFKEPFSLDQLTSARFITFMERSLADTFTPARNSGFAVMDHNASKTVTWAAGLFRTTEDSFDSLGFGDSEYSYTGRVTGTPLYGGEGAEVLHLGGSASFRMDDEVRFRSRPEAHLLNRPADTGAIEADDTLLAGLEAAWVGGPLSAQAEYQIADVSASGAAQDGDFAGWYGFVSYFLTGEHRNYKTSSGSFDRVAPAENFGAGSGAVELAVRYSMLDLNDGAAYTDEMSDTTVGINWYLNPNSRVMLDYVHSEFESGAVDDSADLLMMRFQVDW
jgi:phosphate-selective porin OprO/OprP